MKLKFWKRREDEPTRPAERPPPEPKRREEEATTSPQGEFPKVGPHSGGGDDSFDQRGSFGQ